MFHIILPMVLLVTGVSKVSGLQQPENCLTLNLDINIDYAAEKPCLDSFEYNYKEYSGCTSDAIGDWTPGGPYCKVDEETNSWGYCNQFCLNHTETGQCEVYDQNEYNLGPCLSTFSIADKAYNGCTRDAVNDWIPDQAFCFVNLDTWGYCNKFCKLDDREPVSNSQVHDQKMIDTCEVYDDNFQRIGSSCLSTYFIHTGKEYNGCTTHSVDDWIPLHPWCLTENTVKGWGYCSNSCKMHIETTLCDTGYEMVNGKCQDIDECLQPEICSSPNIKCKNLDGSYECVCVDEYSYTQINGDCYCKFSSIPTLVCNYCPEADVLIVNRVNGHEKKFCKEELKACHLKTDSHGFVINEMNYVYQAGNGYNLINSDPLNIGRRDRGHRQVQIFNPFGYSKTYDTDSTCILRGYTNPVRSKSCSAKKETIVFKDIFQVQKTISESIDKENKLEGVNVEVSSSENAQFTNAIAFGEQVSYSTDGSETKSSTHCVDRGVSESSSVDSTFEKNGQATDSSSNSDSSTTSNTDTQTNSKSSTNTDESNISASVGASGGAFGISFEASASTSHTSTNSNTNSQENSSSNSQERTKSETKEQSSSNGWGATQGRGRSNSNTINTNICQNSDIQSSNQAGGSQDKNRNDQASKGSTQDRSFTVPGYLDQADISKAFTKTSRLLKDSKTILSYTGVKCTTYSMKILPNLFPAFSHDFKIAVQNLHAISQKHRYRLKIIKTGNTTNDLETRLDPKAEHELDDAFSKFISNYGTHYISSVDFGGGTSSVYKMTIRNFTEAGDSQLKGCMEDVLREQVKGKEGMSEETHSKQCNDPKLLETVMRYNQLDNVESYSEGAPLIDDNIAGWSSLSFNNPVHVKFSLQPLITIFQKKAMTLDRISTKEGGPIDTKSIFSWFNPRYTILLDRCRALKRHKLSTDGTRCEMCPTNHVSTQDKMGCEKAWKSDMDQLKVELKAELREEFRAELLAEQAELKTDLEEAFGVCKQTIALTKSGLEKKSADNKREIDATKTDLEEAFGVCKQTIALTKSGLEKKSADNKREIDATKATLNGKIEEIEMRGRKSSICGWRKFWSSEGTITYDTVHTEVEDVNSVLDANTGIYTAGVSGVYEISLSGFTRVDPGVQAGVWLEGAGYGSEDERFIFSYNGASNGGFIHDAAAATRHVTLTAGQQISLKYEPTGKAYFYRIKFCVTLY